MHSVGYSLEFESDSKLSLKETNTMVNLTSGFDVWIAVSWLAFALTVWFIFAED